MGYSDVELTILASPSADVTCRIQSSSIADVQAVQTARFPAGSALGSTASLQIAGVKDLEQDEAVPFTITAWCESSDLRFDMATAESEAAYVTDVRFPIVERMSPVMASYVGQQITIIGRNLGSDTVVEVGGVDVSGQPVMRTILVNTTADELWEVSFFNEPAISSWEVITNMLP